MRDLTRAAERVMVTNEHDPAGVNGLEAVLEVALDRAWTITEARRK